MHTIDLDPLESIFENKSSTISKDLKLNLKRILSEGALEPKESLPILLAIASSVKFEPLCDYAKKQTALFDFTAAQAQEAAESSAIMAMLNTYYRAKHMIGKDEDYRTAGLRMTALANPHLGKERFEMLAFAVSVLNGCETCIHSHEQALRTAGVSTDKVHDIFRLSAVVKGLKTLMDT